MTTKSFEIVGFDLDGTLVDSSGDLTAAVNDTLAAAGRAPLTVAQVKTMVGGGAKHMLKQGLEATGGIDEDAFRPLYKRMLAYYGDHLSVHTRPFPGAITALDALAERGVRVAVCTNKFESFATRLLTDLGLIDRFACIVGGDTLGPGLSKPDRAPIDEMIRRAGGGRTVFVGDSIYDIMAARNAGIPGIAVSFGFLLEPVTQMGADAVIDSFDELIPTLDRLSA
ncbi:HAD family hydrolase [Sphingomonas echinoides]|uniref:HAD family hydrolase n=1 Tax=Sphingomonas echinoides TaxID=59803 RepID=UPI00241338B9|nr:HAD family hydrolase [Sphingomonas echinoides]